MKIETDGLNKLYREILTILQFEDILIMHQAYKGLQVTFSKRLYSKDYVREKIINEYNGSNLKELSKRYGYSERLIRQIAADGPFCPAIDNVYCPKTASVYAT